MAGYGTDEGFAAWLAASGRELPASAPDPAVLRQLASDYLDATYGPLFVGRPTDGIDQERAWPRTGATVWGHAVDPNTVPVAIALATYVAAYHEAHNPGSLHVALVPATAVKRERVDVLEVEYFAGSGDPVRDAVVRIGVVEGLMAPFLAKPIEGEISIRAIGAKGA